MKSKFLLVGDYNRNDFVFVAKLLTNHADFYFIEYLNKKEFTNTECLNFGKVIYWKDYKSAYALLSEIKPEKVIFYFVESYNHVALIVACKVLNIPTFHLEHGVRFSLSYYEFGNATAKIPTKSFPFLKKISDLRNVYDKLKNRQFFKNTISESPNKEKNFLKDYFSVRSSNSIFETFRILQNDIRLPDQYISFSPQIFNYHKELENLPDNFPVKFIGIPQFDVFFQWKSLVNTGENILFIDQPLHEQVLYGWNQQGKEVFLKELVHHLSLLNKKLYIKPHPLNDLKVFKNITADNVTIVLDEWNIVVQNINIVLGFSSTLLLPFMAMDHVSCFTIEMHPSNQRNHIQNFFWIQEPATK